MRRASVRRWIALTTVVAAAGAVAWPGVAPAGAAAAFDAAGSVRCSMSGVQSSRRGPTITAPDDVVQVLKAELTCTTGSTGDANVTLTSGRLVATSRAAAPSCSTAALPGLQATITWSAAGGSINPTSVLWSGGTNRVSPRAAKRYAAPASVITGSYAGGTAALRIVGDRLGAASCSARAGTKQVPFTGARGVSTFVIPSSPPSVVFGDEFTGTTLDSSKWRANWVGETDAAISKPVNSSEQGCYDPKQVSVSGGYLRLDAVARSCTATNGVTYPYASGLVQTKDHFTFAYGRVEARIWMPPGAGAIQNWPAFWTDGTGVHPSTGEMDVVEGIAGRACFHFHSPGGAPGGCAAAANPAGWHTYAAEWRSGVVTYSYDGVEVGRITQGVTGAPMFVVLNLGLSSTVSGPVTVPSRMLVDYVRVRA